LFLKIYYGGDEMSEEDKEKNTDHNSIKDKTKPLEAEPCGEESGFIERAHGAVLQKKDRK
jgi:hypothetical protein